MDRLSSRTEMTKDRISELEDRSIKFTQLEQQREKKKKRVSGSCEMITKALKFIPCFLSKHQNQWKDSALTTLIQQSTGISSHCNRKEEKGDLALPGGNQRNRWVYFNLAGPDTLLFIYFTFYFIHFPLKSDFLPQLTYLILKIN